jgi:hypothetical protein
MLTRGGLAVMKKAAHFHVEQTGHECLVNTSRIPAVRLRRIPV